MSPRAARLAELRARWRSEARRYGRGDLVTLVTFAELREVAAELIA